MTEQAPELEAARLRVESAQIENLLGELRELVTPPAWQRIEQLLRRVIALYAAGLARALEHARTAGAVASKLDELASDDELLASLLVLHGLHPLTTEQRIRRALEMVRSELDLDETGLVLVTIEDGVVHLEASVALGGGAMSTQVAEAVVRRVIEAAAPEITSIQIAGLPVAPDPGLVQIRTNRHTP